MALPWGASTSWGTHQYFLERPGNSALWLSGSGLQAHEVFKHLVCVCREFRNWLMPGDWPYAENNQ